MKMSMSYSAVLKVSLESTCDHRSSHFNALAILKESPLVPPSGIEPEYVV